MGWALNGVPLAKRVKNGSTPQPPPEGGALLSSHAQLMLFTAEGLIRAMVRHASKGICHPPSIVLHSYLNWLSAQGVQTKERTHEPATGWLSTLPELGRRRGTGKATIAALIEGRVFTLAERPNESKGNGALTRIAPVGLAVDDPFKRGVEIAALTHGHPTGYLAAGFFAELIHEVANGASIEAGIMTGRAHVEEHHYGDEVLVAIERAAMAATRVRVGEDRLEQLRRLGRGYTADEALQIALFCIYVARGLPDALALAVAHEGDVDATATLVGAVLGCVGGLGALPGDWLSALELRHEIEVLIQDLFEAPHANLDGARWHNRYPGY